LIKAVFLDIDGVLTDGRVTINQAGEESKTISFDDIDGVFALKRAGMKVGFITCEDNHFSEYVKRRFSPDYFISGCKDKLEAFKGLMDRESLDVSEVCYLGDSKKDIGLLDYLPLSFAPSDVDAGVRAAAKSVLRAGRGQGVIRELAKLALSMNEHPHEAFWTERIDEHLETVKSIRADRGLLETIREAGDILVSSFGSGGKLLICGNGGSAADSQHIATEFVSRFLLERPGICAEALTANTSSLTAIGNDYGFDSVFARQVEANGRKGDVLIGISTSGNSRNVVIAMEKARETGMTAIGLMGGNRDVKMAAVSDCSIHVPSTSTPRIQEGHILIGHMLCEYVESKLYG
jgi:D-sedoheptulose 7-phosphate isomerase